ncbi:TPA: fimbrial protein [Pseudomonas aeruginosa]|uniref:fimbrial protein n=1 Tax=Pseudomonas aeruginosa TaxID=287 RepID=UPI002B2623EA|nr:fimbrial protein [Pseudomonas aeruginosa]
MIKSISRLIVMGMLLALSQKGFALACLKDARKIDYPPYLSGYVTDVSNISTTVAVPTVLPKNTVLWRSPDEAFEVSCWQDRPWAGQYVYIYLTPSDPGNAMLGGDLELGVRINGTDYYCDNQMEVFDGRCRKRLDFFYIPACGGSERTCAENAVTKSLTVGFFVSKKSGPKPGREGSLTGVSGPYGAFQFDGVGGMNVVQGYNFRMNVTGLDKLRYVACSSTLSISPKTVNFGAVASQAAEMGKTIVERPFSITANKTCNSVYGLNARLSAVNASVSNTDTLVPNDNPSVGIRLLDQQDSQRPLVFDREFVLVAPSPDQVVVKNFLAQLRWLTSQPTLGKFNAAATVDVYYK